jgi:hypothetical protein
MKTGTKKKYVSPKIKSQKLQTHLFNLRSIKDQIGGFNLLAATDLCSCGGCTSGGCVWGCGELPGDR